MLTVTSLAFIFIYFSSNRIFYFSILCSSTFSMVPKRVLAISHSRCVCMCMCVCVFGWYFIIEKGLPAVVRSIENFFIFLFIMYIIIVVWRLFSIVNYFIIHLNCGGTWVSFLFIQFFFCFFLQLFPPLLWH